MNDPFKLFHQESERIDREFEADCARMTAAANRTVKRGVTAVALVIIANIVLSLGGVAALIFFIFWCCRHFGIIGN